MAIRPYRSRDLTPSPNSVNLATLVRRVSLVPGEVPITILADRTFEHVGGDARVRDIGKAVIPGHRHDPAEKRTD